MVNLFDLSHLKDRYRGMITDRSVNLHATLAEMLGTGILVFIGTSAESSGMIENAVVFGVVYFALLCAMRHHGGAHLNPAITIACMLSGVTGAVQAAVFIVVQVLGAIIGSAFVLGLTPDDDREDALLGANVRVKTRGMTKDRAFGAELIATFVLAYIYLQVFHHPRSAHRMLAPLAVGLAYTGLLAYAGPMSSGSLNPARSLGPAACSREGDAGDDLWIWVIGPIVGAIIAVPMHLISVTDLPEIDREGHMITKSSSAVDVAQVDKRAPGENVV